MDFRNNLLGESTVKKSVNLLTFADEVKVSNESNWIYLGLVSLRKEHLQQAYAGLIADRRTAGYDNEIGWSDIRKSSKEKANLARLWIERLVSDHTIWNFSVIGIDGSKLALDAFGSGKGNQLSTSYRRFYRTNLYTHLLRAYGDADEINVEATFHDREGRLEADEWFSWHPQHIVSLDSRISFTQPGCYFVDSCHVKEPEVRFKPISHFIQLADIVAGVTRYAFEDVGSNPSRDTVAKPILPMFERLSNKNLVNNPTGRYQHHRRASVSFFPSTGVTFEDLDNPLERGQSLFFIERTPLLKQRLDGQASLNFG